MNISSLIDIQVGGRGEMYCIKILKITHQILNIK